VLSAAQIPQKAGKIAAARKSAQQNAALLIVREPSNCGGTISPIDFKTAAL